MNGIVLPQVVDSTHYSGCGWTLEPQIRNARIQPMEEKVLPESPGITVTVAVDVITSGDFATAILKRAKKEDASFIIKGSRGRGPHQGSGAGERLK